MQELPHEQNESADTQQLALLVALKHPAVSADPQLLCATACTSQPWREAVQQCGACNTAIVITPDAALLQLNSLVRWLPNHSPLVKSITAKADGRPWSLQYGQPGSQAWQANFQPALQALQDTLQQASNIGAAQAAAAASAEAASAAARSPAAGVDALHSESQQQQQQQQVRCGLHLASFCSDLPWPVGMLDALPAHSLTRLDLNLTATPEVRGSALAAALARLSCLQQLHLECMGSHVGIPGGCLAAVPQLSLLTSLSLAGNWSNFDRPLQQALAQPLPLRQLHVAVGMPDRTPALNLVQLTQLEQLSTPQKLGHGSLLPQQLQRLQLGPYAHSSELIAVLAPQHLQQLQRVQLMDVRGKQVLLQLAQLPALQQLGLQYTSCEVAATTVAAWQHLLQLSELSLVGSLQSSVPRMRLIMAGVAAATSLTKLEVYVYMPMSELRAGYEGDSSSELGVALCSWLSGLPRLQELCLECETPLAPRDALALTSLTSLTRLALPRARGGVGDTRAAAVAASLSQLQHLDLRQCKLRSVAALAAIGQLKQLTELRLEGNSGITRQGVWQLTGLASLQQLGIDYSPKVDSAVLKRF